MGPSLGGDRRGGRGRGRCVGVGVGVGGQAGFLGRPTGERGGGEGRTRGESGARSSVRPQQKKKACLCWLGTSPAGIGVVLGVGSRGALPAMASVSTRSGGTRRVLRSMAASWRGLGRQLAAKRQTRLKQTGYSLKLAQVNSVCLPLPCSISLDTASYPSSLLNWSLGYLCAHIFLFFAIFCSFCPCLALPTTRSTPPAPPARCASL